MRGGIARCRCFPTKLCAILLAVGAWTRLASAHAPAQATGIFSDSPGGVASAQWVRTNRGVILRASQSEPPRMLCNDAYSATLSELVPMIAAPDGLLLASYDGGIQRAAADGCSVTPVEAPLAGRHVMDLATSSDGVQYFALLAPGGEHPGRVLVSVDAGLTWEERGEIPAFGSALGIAPSDASRVYVTAQVEAESGEGIHRLFVSGDAGITFTPREVPLLDSEVRAFVLGVGLRDPDTVLLRTLPGNPEVPERLLLSRDGGERLSEVFSAVGPLVAAFTDEVVWVGGQAGLFRSDDQGATFEEVPSDVSHFGCLVPMGQSLLACGYRDLAFGVFRSELEQTAFHPELRFSEVSQQVACGDDSEIQATCQANFTDWREENEDAHEEGGAGGSGGQSASGAGGAVKPPPSRRGSAGCSFQSLSAGSSLPIALLLGLSYGARRWRGPRRRPR
jgi:hypothetical protein